MIVEFFVKGYPVPKQSYKHSKHGGYLPKRVTNWQETVGWVAACATPVMFEGKVRVDLQFYLPHNRRVDLDNLSKAVLDGCNGILWEDDRQVYRLCLWKFHDKENPGVMVTVRKLDNE